MRRDFIVAAAIGGVILTAGAATASPVMCPNDTTDSKVFIVDTSPGSVCSLTGAGNVNGSASDPFLLANPTWEFVDSTGGSSPGTLDGSLTMGTGSASTFTISPSVWGTYASVALALKTGQNAPGPDWAVFILPAGTLTGGWEIREYDSNGVFKGKNLSHGIIYGLPCAEPCQEEQVGVAAVDQIPEPTALTLLGFGVLAASAGRRAVRRKAGGGI